ncbi:PLP-dependent transferase [Trichodelitschia bisporula]|uniref:PLP-dependent transferase n=1 Tax=Trichodelitschia bisporula TaxID=703511 RepID=A0A6G1HL95_9PEZI|nr:PLP-dependent transferase [Trichodelitschia bisporula]
MPTWANMLEFLKGDPAFFAKFVDMYPRFVLHRDVKQLIGVLLSTRSPDEGLFALPFPSPVAAHACADFISATPRTDGKDPLDPSTLSITSLNTTPPVTALFFPAARMMDVVPWWTITGRGLSSRAAEAALSSIANTPLAESPLPGPETPFTSPAHDALRARIAQLLNRAQRQGSPYVAAGDVHLYQTGMTAICAAHTALLHFRGTKTVMFNLPFHSTVHVFEYFGPGVQFFPLGTELAALETYLESEAAAGSPVQAIWTEIPSNPLLVTADLAALKALAMRFEAVLVVDDTIGSFANVDVLPEADVLVTSLTKSFSGYADVMGGNVVLNPSSKYYTYLATHFNGAMEEMFVADAETLLHNSADYLARTAVLNRNAQELAKYLSHRATLEGSSVTRVYYPQVAETKEHYEALMRPPTAEFTPGYGCLLSVEFTSVGAAKAFYDHLYVHNGPHLGAHLTLALPHPKALYDKELEEVREWGMKEEQIRISVGLEEVAELLITFMFALTKADEAEAARDLVKEKV